MILSLRGIKTHNLKNIDLDIPKHKIVVITGVSGSGKSSLVFDTIHAEGRYRYLDALSSETGAFIKKQQRPTILDISGITPTVSLKQSSKTGIKRSVADITGLTSRFKIMFTHLGEPFCPFCNKKLEFYSVEEVVNVIVHHEIGSRIVITAPFKRPLDKEFVHLLLQKGFTRLTYNDEVINIDSDKNDFDISEFEVIIDRVKLKESSSGRLFGSVELAYKLSEGIVHVKIGDTLNQFYEKKSCPTCGYKVKEAYPGLFSRFSGEGGCMVCHGKGYLDEKIICDECKGTGYSPDAYSYRWNNLTINDLHSFNLEQVKSQLTLHKSPKQEIFDKISSPILNIIDILGNFGLNIPLSRKLETLSTGEVQLIKIASLNFNSLSGVIVILDEPTKGLTSEERPLLLDLIKKIWEKGNTVILVDHDVEFLKEAHLIIELGPGAGVNGGKIVFQGNYEELLNNEESVTGAFLSGRLSFPSKKERKPQNIKFGIKNITYRHFKNRDFTFKYNRWTVVTGAMGSGKSTLLNDLIRDYMTSGWEDDSIKGDGFGVELFPGGLNYIDFEKSPTTLNSFVASYISIWKEIRELFSSLPISKIRGWKKNRFSLKNKGGRCDLCKGTGIDSINLGNLTKLIVPCDQCGGKRYNNETLDIKYRGKSIADILELSLDEAGNFFAHFPGIAKKIALLQEIGLGYLTLGQPVKTLSGGETQRIKLGRDLFKGRKRPSLYLMDEPLTGLHMKDAAILGDLLQKLVDEGHTIITTDHTKYLSPMADEVIRLK